jgi:uncharacterized delta-60 repeat protein
MYKQTVIFLFILALFSSRHVFAQCPMPPTTLAGTNDSCFTPFDKGLHQADREIQFAAYQPDGKLIIGGDFKTINGQARATLARLNQDGTLDNSYNPDPLLGFNQNITDRISSLSIQSSGKTLVHTLSLFSSSKILRLNLDGSVDNTFNTVYWGESNMVVLPDDKFLINSDNKLFRYHSNGLMDSSFQFQNTFGTGSINGFKVGNNGIYVYGSFDSFNGVTCPGMIKLNLDGSRNLSFSQCPIPSNGIGDVLPTDDGKILVSGGFGSVYPREILLRLNEDGSLDNSFSNGQKIRSPQSANFYPYGKKILKTPQGKIILAGNFFRINSITANSVMVFNSDGTADSQFIPDSDTSEKRYIKAIAFKDGKIFLAGLFRKYNGLNRNYYTRITEDGNTDITFLNPVAGYGFDNVLSALCIQQDDKIIVGGLFGNFNGVSRNRIARLNRDGFLDLSFNPGIGFEGGTCRRIKTLPDGKILAVGNFTKYSGFVAKGIVRLNEDGSIDNTFNSGTGFGGGSAADFLVQADGKIIVVGYFETYNGTNRNKIVRLNSDGTIDITFQSNLNGLSSLESIAFQTDGRIIAGGQRGTFTNMPGGFMRFNTNGSVDNSFQTPAGFSNSHVSSLVVLPDNKIIIYGDFQFKRRKNIAKFNPDGGLDSGYVNNNGCIVDDDAIGFLAMQSDGQLLFSTLHTCPGYNLRNMKFLHRYKLDGTLDSNFSSILGPNFILSGLGFQSDGKAIITGAFTAYSGNPESYITRIFTENQTVSIDPAIKNKAMVSYPNPASRFITLKGTSSIQELQLFDSHGRAQQVSFSKSSEQGLDISNLKAGIYWLRLITARGVSMQKVVKE